MDNQLSFGSDGVTLNLVRMMRLYRGIELSMRLLELEMVRLFLLCVRTNIVSCHSRARDDPLIARSRQIHTPGNPSMGSLSLSMPPSKNQINYTAPSTQLLGGTSEEDMMLGQQVSSRLAKKIGWPIFVSCSFSENEVGGDLGLGLDVSPAMAVAVAEKEVARILMREKQSLIDTA